MLKLILLKAPIIKFAVTVGLSAMALLSPANSDAAEAHAGKARNLKLGPGLPLGPAWHHDATLQKPKLLQSPREKETALMIQRMGPFSGATNSRGPSSVVRTSRIAISDYYAPDGGAN